MFKSGLAVLLAIAALVLALIFGALPWNSIDYRPDMFEEAGKAAAALFVVAVFLERAMAVVNDLLFGVEVVEAKNQIRLADVTNSVADAATAEARLEAIDENRQRVRLGGSFLAAVLLAAAGARTLGELLVIEASGGGLVISGPQLQLFRTMDILLTAGLLAGGSNGLAAIIDLVRKRVDASKAQQGADLSQLRRTGFTEARSIPGWPVPFGGPNRLEITKRSEQGEGMRLREDFSRDRSVSPDDDVAFLEWLGGDQAAGASLDVALTAKTPRIALSLDKLRSQLNAAYPNRSTKSDGWIGDEAHCGGGGTSDHCPNIKDGNKWVVTAFDATHDPGDGCDMEAVTAAVVGAKDPRIKYIIWNSRICASYPVGNNAAWTWRPYTGSNPHDKHAHFSVLADKAQYDDDGPWTIG